MPKFKTAGNPPYSIRLDQDLIYQVRIHAAILDITICEYVTKAIQRQLRRDEKMGIYLQRTREINGNGIGS